MSRELHLEEKIDKLMEWMRAIHDRLDLHEWTKESRPWDSAENLHPGKPCTRKCRHDPYHVVCLCGENRSVDKKTYDAAEDRYDGY